ncbi:MAG TPA: hypothetical protein VNW47_03140 [Terriglobales bacterium]|nr:hypothetical protein [Terriglobales bacterium]
MKLRHTIPIALCLVLPLLSVAQDETPLGDLARNLRKNKAPQQLEAPVIDNENLAQATEDAKNRRPVGHDKDKFVLSIDPTAKTINASSPDVTCSLSFNARAGSLLVNPVLVETLPLPELLKIDGPASIQDENFQLEVFNGTDWDLREITVGLTLERKPGQAAEDSARARVIPASQNSLQSTMEKRSDVTLLYHLKATAKPFSTTTFKENIGITPGPDEDWRWSIVEAKGVRTSEVQLPPEWLTPIPAPRTTLDLPTPLPPAVAPPITPEVDAAPNR